MESTEDKEWDCGNGKIVILQMTFILEKKEGKESIKNIYRSELNARGGGGCGRSGNEAIILEL